MTTKKKSKMQELIVNTCQTEILHYAFYIDTDSRNKNEINAIDVEKLSR